MIMRPEELRAGMIMTPAELQDGMMRPAELRNGTIMRPPELRDGHCNEFSTTET